jgi:hypothetical protein
MRFISSAIIRPSTIYVPDALVLRLQHCGVVDGRTLRPAGISRGRVSGPSESSWPLDNLS